MAFRVSGGMHDGPTTVVVHSQEGVRRSGGLHRIERYLEIAISSVLETNRHGETARHFPVSLGLGSAGADGGPRHQIRDVLWDDRAKQFRCGR